MSSNPLGAVEKAGQRELSWQIIVCVVLAFPILVFGGMAFGPSKPGSGEPRIGRYGLAVCVPLFALALASQIAAMRRRDIHPDILIELASEGSIYQCGRSHFTCNGIHVGRCVRIRVLIQNLCDGPGEFTLRLEGDAARRWPDLRCAIPPAAVVVADLEAPLPTMEQMPAALSLPLNPEFRAGGNPIRFKRRMGVTHGINPALTVLLLFAGHFVHVKPTRLVIPIGQFEPENDAIGADDRAGWDTHVVWSPTHPASREQLTAALA